MGCMPIGIRLEGCIPCFGDNLENGLIVWIFGNLFVSLQKIFRWYENKYECQY